MGMNIGSSGGSGNDPEPMMEMNMTPLIDVMLVLIIMLIITIPIQNHAIKLNMPTGNPPVQSAPPIVDTVDIDPTGTVLWNGAPMANRAELESKLQAVVAMGNVDEVHLRPNKLVEYKSVAAVMASAQRLGVTKIGIVGNEQFMNQ
ncbi:biopolymer transporter ExbD [Glaciimonas sp. PAMC28666]|uniref:ExbD/TolR family protein n=1 Tax=Glaciimonas sp. PAMC28666 TaxID=2807626 RepID=UPI0019666A13|nr:biopolymer transporter ExbD [Glaciimonas sp. PAMC28666]QRX81591.1 biopolymer transporter ExbD [Glaciimonas sp. PAMC28666]